MPHCWKSHVAAQMSDSFSWSPFNISHYYLKISSHKFLNMLKSDITLWQHFGITMMLIDSHLSKQTIRGRYRPTSETPFKWRFTGGLIVVPFYMLTGMCPTTNSANAQVMWHLVWNNKDDIISYVHIQWKEEIYFCLFDLILYIPVNNLSVISGQVFLGWTSTNQGLMCLAQGHNAVMPMRLEPAALQARVKHSTTEPLCSQKRFSSMSEHNGHFYLAFKNSMVKSYHLTNYDSKLLIGLLSIWEKLKI